MTNTELCQEVISFINLEADLLDQGEFNEWLTLWQQDGLYIVPIDQQTTDFANVLNYAYDNHEMRKKRVHRLYSGESISTTPRARTIRLSGRHRIVRADEESVEVRCAQSLWEYRKGNSQHYIADLTYTLVRSGEGWLIAQKVVRTINGEDFLRSIGYII